MFDLIWIGCSVVGALALGLALWLMWFNFRDQNHGGNLMIIGVLVLGGQFYYWLYSGTWVSLSIGNVLPIGRQPEDWAGLWMLWSLFLAFPLSLAALIAGYAIAKFSSYGPPEG